jgi:8-oxo-dGTP pyrophosphatase MutT (NUDIX family)
VTEEGQVFRYTAAGGVVFQGRQVLVLRRPSHDEIRLPKGHIESGESEQQAALREVREESGYGELVLQADLGAQVVDFDHDGRHVVRVERYFLMTLKKPTNEPSLPGERQFDPIWLTWDEALAALTFEAEREWVRRARSEASKRMVGEYESNY